MFMGIAYEVEEVCGRTKPSTPKESRLLCFCSNRFLSAHPFETAVFDSSLADTLRLDVSVNELPRVK